MHIFAVYSEDMQILFEKTYLENLYTKAEGDKRHRFQPQIIRKYIRIIDLMMEVDDVSSLSKYQSLNYEKLRGDRKGLSSVRINSQYRIEFAEVLKDGETFASVCNIIELSNHYK